MTAVHAVWKREEAARSADALVPVFDGLQLAHQRAAAIAAAKTGKPALLQTLPDDFVVYHRHGDYSAFAKSRYVGSYETLAAARAAVRERML